MLELFYHTRRNCVIFLFNIQSGTCEINFLYAWHDLFISIPTVKIFWVVSYIITQKNFTGYQTKKL